jgi:hypothetical protein
MDDPKILYVNHMINGLSDTGQESVHIMFDDGSIMRIQIDQDGIGTQGAGTLLQQVLNLVNELPKSEEEIAPICLGDTTCMYCNGKGCVNCRRS